MSGFLPVYFEAPLVNPSPTGLYAVTQWTDDAGPLRWLSGGVEVRRHNYGNEDGAGVWGAAWNVAEEDLTEDDVKKGERPENLDPFEAITIWAEDQCDLTTLSQEEVKSRAAQNLRLREQFLVEEFVAARMLSDSVQNETGNNITDALSRVEKMLAATGTVGLVHAGAHIAALAANAQLIVRSGNALKTPMGHTWVFGSGYSEALDWKLVGTTQTFGWRSAPTVREADDVETGTFVAIAERSVVVGYEAAVGYAEID